MAGGSMEFRFRHTMLPVADLDRSVAFYTGLLGMKLVRERKDPDGGKNVAYVAYGDEGTFPALELIENTGDADKPWAGHIAIAVSDLPALAETLEAHGVPFSRPMSAPEGGTNAYIAIIRDPDGFEVELNQRRGGVYS